ncbi:hypothetical protein [Stutzerimonas nitrititolerans]|uniref:DUF4175 domain-containing protein n=1 Tax=Stutzerimonas nitrititolerans TaxID=2482751 RepID=A0ABX9V5R9_9GAMM|nr:hypothetical protein [Stutzerimonas nitrititolerans]RMI00719.1 hypothetical protein EA795_12245 [Stutzerimonas nitrititolerans]RRV24305.1 hypothetical protein EGJ29_08150 [Pseudomonas sp. s199]
MIRIWLWPVVIALLSILGLVAGLVSEGPGDWLSWAALAVPVVIGCHGLARGRAAKQSPNAAMARPANRG